MEDRALFQKAEEAWRFAWERFFHPDTGIFYDFISSKDPGKRFDHLPTLEEVQAGRPNTNGWGTGMENGMISAGVLLAALCDRFEATGDTALREKASAVFSGMARCARAGQSPGFLARAVSPRDGRSCYIESSRDQYTHFFHGLWRYFHTALPGDAERKTIGELATAAARRMAANVTAANDFRFKRDDGTRGLVDKMWECEAHEAARLPMFYAVAFDLTGDRHWQGLYRRYAEDAARQTLLIPESMPTVYAYLQAQVSLEPLAAIEAQGALQQAWRQAMAFVAARTRRFNERCLAYAPQRLDQTPMEWRKWPPKAQHPPAELLGGHAFVNRELPAAFHAEFRTIREPAEALLAQAMAPEGLDPAGVDFLHRCVVEVDYDAVITESLFYPIAAYWRAEANARTR